MAEKKGRGAQRRRGLTQAIFTVAGNAYLPGWLSGGLFTGPGKYLCLPGLSCYSCPGALAACPIGALQAVVGSREYQAPFYVAGMLTVAGAVGGRAVCGWACPFGWAQDLLHRIPISPRITKLPGERGLRFIKYLVLIALVLLTPLFLLDAIGQGTPGFCKWLCPSGTLMAGWPLALFNRGIRGSLGGLFAYKSLILIGLAVLSLFLYRPFCRYLCPLGAIYGLFNRVALFRYAWSPENCVHCASCETACPFGLPVRKQPNSADCIRCGRCRDACPTGALGARRAVGVASRKTTSPLCESRARESARVRDKSQKTDSGCST